MNMLNSMETKKYLLRLQITNIGEINKVVKNRFNRLKGNNVIERRATGK